MTRNTEYHLRDGVCIAVRDRRTSTWRPSHIALNRKLEGGVKFFDNGAAVPLPEGPEIGDALYFNDAFDEDRQIVTSRIERIDRPAKVVVSMYPRVVGGN